MNLNIIMIIIQLLSCCYKRTAIINYRKNEKIGKESYNMKCIKRLLLVLALAMLISTMAVATVHATSDVKNQDKNSGVTIESKEKKVTTYKITWNSNGGKIGTKKTKVTSVKKGSKIGKLAATPKRSGFVFKGWYTKKNGGKKISKNTKPTKSVTYFAHWMKGTPNRSIDSAVVGEWFSGSVSGGRYDVNSGRYLGASGVGFIHTYKNDGTCFWVVYSSYGSNEYVLQGDGIYTAKNGVIKITNRVVEDSNNGGKTYNPKRNIEDLTMYYSVERNEYNQIIMKSSYDSAGKVASDSSPWKKRN